MTIKTISGGWNNKEQWWNLNNSTMLLYTSGKTFCYNSPNDRWVVLKATLKRNNIQAFIDGWNIRTKQYKPWKY